MAWVAAVLGALAGFAIGVVFTEIIFANDSDWPNVIPTALAVAGWLAGRALVRRRRASEHGAPSASA